MPWGPKLPARDLSLLRAEIGGAGSVTSAGLWITLNEVLE
jgi:hypothetical protein